MDLATRFRPTDWILHGPVPRIVKADADPGQAGADYRAGFCIIFSNAAGENDQVDPLQCRDHRGQLLTNGITKHLDGKSGIGIG